MKSEFRRHTITQETFNAVKAVMEKFPTMSQKEISALLTGSGIPVAPSTVSRLFRAQSFDDYIDITRAGYSTKRCKNTEPVTLCDMAEGKCFNADRATLEMSDRDFYEETSKAMAGFVQAKETSLVKEITDRLDAIIENQKQHDDKMKTIAILLTALLNEWRGNTDTIKEIVKEVANV